ncbi:hypothetical protein [Streptomyces sudanensis]|uniref:hypothetical protein n=1 Tax=Streptomyces sudanensis TaxID=436397 RepID=UPI0027E5864E|nr:hypothetical protein [Streptomyces sudanensis]
MATPTHSSEPGGRATPGVPHDRFSGVVTCRTTTTVPTASRASTTTLVTIFWRTV